MKTPSQTTLSQPSVVQALGSVSLPENELGDFIDALTTAQPSVLRFRRDVEKSALLAMTEPVPWYRLAGRLSDRSIQPSRFLSYACGDYFLQDAGSLLALAACGADGPLPAADAAGEILVCDLCAAPGGKATALLEMLGNRGFLLANEPIRSRVPPLSYNLARTGSDRYAVSSMDPDALADRLAGQFDLVLVDAPCSGQALLARGRQSAAALTSRQILHSAARQRRILSAAVRLTRPNGRLIYSTCTFAEAENEQQMQLLVEQNAVNPYPVDRLESYQCQAACYRLWPQRHQCAGSFTASMQVVSGDSASWSAGRRPRRKQTAKPPADLRRWFAVDEEQLRLDSREAAILGWPADAPEWLERIAMGGPELMHRTGQTWKPSHAAALRRVDRARSLRSIEVDDATAKEFLSGRPIPCHSTGWQVVRHQGRPLGWIKAGSGIGKNHLPQAARLMGPWLG